jgi:type VI secretion system protein ImpF
MEKQSEIRPSFLDRLMSDDYGHSSDWGYSMARMRESLQRDLQILLNTRSRFLSPPPELEHSQHSILNYGLPDLGSMNLSSERGKAELVNAITDTLRCFEPRFKSVKVQFVSSDGTTGIVRVRIEAMMYADPVPEMVAFDTVLSTSEKTLDLKESPV